MPSLATAQAPVGPLYRGSAHSREPVRGYLTAARDALEMAVLSLGGAGDDTSGARMARCEQARAFLVEAVRALGRARVHDRRVKTLSVAVVMACERDLDAEAKRLYALATRLAWDNHAVLPPKAAAAPLPPEDERQLARLAAGLRRHARLETAVRGRLAALATAAFGIALAAGAGTVELTLLGGLSAVLVGGFVAGRRGARCP